MCAQMGITPACAGRSVCPGTPTMPTEDHPRVRGEKLVVPLRAFLLQGSPPRARGEDPARKEHAGRDGITPACAGRSTPPICTCPSCEDHPRVRGEKKSARAALPAGKGSPPRARGEGCSAGARQGGQGITPACAGRSSAMPSSMMIWQDHPRVRGEKQNAIGQSDYYLGSPPRARGEESHTAPFLSGCRITPACAGRSSVSVAVVPV